jgi:hypothetical protein
MSQETKTFFEKNKFVVIKNHMNQELCDFAYEYCKMKVKREDHLQTYYKNLWNEHKDGSFGDPMVPRAYGSYADPMMESILQLSLPKIMEYTGLNLVPNYSYWRFYQKGNDLYRHQDRYSCEISVTMCIGYNIDNVDNEKYPNYNWAMWVKPEDGKEFPIQLNPGDIVIYRGDEVEHWREQFLGLNQAQVFMHYNDTGSSLYTGKKYDGREGLGIPFPPLKLFR